MTSSERRGRRVPLLATGVLLALAVVSARVLLESRAALRAGEGAEARGDGTEAVRHYLHAARLHLPGNPFERQAMARLDELATRAEKAGDADGERRALEAIRAAALGARSFYTPHERRLDDADRRLARLYARVEDPRVDPAASPDERERWHAERLARRPGPAVGWVIVALGGGGLWIGAVLAFVRRGLDAGLRLRRGPAIAAGIAFALGLALFLTGLRLA